MTYDENEIQQVTDIDAALENLDIYAREKDARSCRDIGIALARDLEIARSHVDWLRSENTILLQFHARCTQVGLKVIAERDALTEQFREEVQKDV